MVLGFEPSTITCRNIGYDGISVTWDCSADLDERVRFGRTVVSCEGYAYSGDSQVLAGSCGVTYTLQYTSTGRADKQQQSYSSGWRSSSSSWSGTSNVRLHF